MSYILDALKKSDKQRQQERVPDLNTVQLELAPPKKKKAAWLLPLAALVLANVIFILFFVIHQKQPATKTQAIVPSSGQAQQDTVQERRQAIAPQSTPAPSPASHGPRQAEPAAAEDESTAANMAEDDAASRQDSAAAPPMSHGETAAGPQPQEDAQAGDTQAGAAEETNTIAPLEEDASASPVTATHPEKYNETPAQDQPQRPRPAETADSSPVEPKGGLTKKALHIDQLPGAIRQQLPDIHISAHLFYEDKPASRFASINGKILREGQTLAPDLEVAEISTDGVIFRYQKYLFYVPVF